MPGPIYGISLGNLPMRRLPLLFLFCLFFSTGNAQAGTALQPRLDSFLKLTTLLDIERILDFTYPKLFTIVPREQMAELMKNTFDNGELKVVLDSLKQGKIYPPLTTEEGSFVKVDYSMIMRMHFTDMDDDSTDYSEKAGFIVGVLENKYGTGNALLDPLENRIDIRVHTALLAVRDSYSPQWTFLNFDKNEPMTSLLLSQELIDKLSSQ